MDYEDKKAKQANYSIVTNLSLLLLTLTLDSLTYKLLFQKEHPSALSYFQEMISAAKEKRIVVFLDYDGTLSPIMNDPDSTFMSDLDKESSLHHLTTQEDY